MRFFRKRKYPTTREPGPKQKLDSKKVEAETEKVEQQMETDKVLHQRMIQQLSSDEEVYRSMIASKYKLELPPAPRPEDKQKHEIDSIITRQALEEIKNDPELTKEFARKRLESIVGEIPEGKEDEEYPQGTAIGQVLEELDNYEELKSRFGGKSGPLGGLINAELLTELAKQVPNILALLQGRQPPIQPTTYVVEVNGQLREMDAVGYKRLLEQRELKRLEAGKKPEKAEVKPEEEPKLEETKPAVEELEEPRPVLELDLSLLADYLDGEPIPFIDSLIELQQNDSPEAMFALNLMIENDADTIIKMLQPFKANEEYRRIVEKLERKQADEEWLQIAIEYYRSVSG